MSDLSKQIQNLFSGEDEAQPTLIHTIVTKGVSYMEQAMGRYIQELENLILIESPSDYPPGLNDMAEHLAALLRRAGMSTTIVEHPCGNALFAELNGVNPDAPVILLMGHHDTVHPVGVAPSRLHIDGDKFIGPGTVDMKAGLLCGIYALKWLVAAGYTNFNKIVFLSVPDEEISERYHVELIREITHQVKPLVLGLEGARSIGNVVVQRKGCARYKLTATGRAAHAGSTPETGLNAVLELAHQVVQLCSINQWCEGLTINAGPIKGGSLPNVVSDLAEIILEIRFLRTEDRLATEQRWAELIQRQLVPGVQLSLELVPQILPPMEASDGNIAIASQIQWVTEQILHVSFDPEIRGGGSDACTTSQEGCPSVDGLGAIGGRAHSSEEFVLLSPIPQKVALLMGTLVALTARAS